jgi:dipeptide/tripeptide permease
VTSIYTAVTECFEELAYYGIQFNLVTFLKNVLHENNVTAARNYTNWQGTCYIAPLIGAIIADSYLGRYLTTVAFFIVYLLVCKHTKFKLYKTLFCSSSSALTTKTKQKR